MTEVMFAVPGDMGRQSGGYAYARRLLDVLPRHGIAIRPLALPERYPTPTEEDLAETARLVAGTAPDAVLLIDGIALSAMPPSLVAGFARPVVALVHQPLGLETGLAPNRQAELIASEAQVLALAAHVIVTSPLTGRLLAAEFNVSTDRMTVAMPGTDPAPRARGTGSPVRLLAVGSVSAHKGYPALVAALGPLSDLDWTLTVAGTLERDRSATEAVERAVARAGLQERVALPGVVPDAALHDLYDRADLFVSPSLYEGYGMALGEALARGLPLVVSTGGAAVETLPDEAALKVPPGDSAALTLALRRAITDPDLRARLADASWAAGQALPRWPETGERVAHVLKQITG